MFDLLDVPDPLVAVDLLASLDSSLKLSVGQLVQILARRHVREGRLVHELSCQFVVGEVVESFLERGGRLGLEEEVLVSCGVFWSSESLARVCVLFVEPNVQGRRVGRSQPKRNLRQNSLVRALLRV